MITMIPNILVVHFPTAKYFPPILPRIELLNMANGITGTPCPNPKTNSIKAPTMSEISRDNIQIITGKTNDTAHGAQARAKKIPRMKPPRKIECRKSFVEKLIIISFILRFVPDLSDFFFRDPKEILENIWENSSPRDLRLLNPSKIIRIPAIK